MYSLAQIVRMNRRAARGRVTHAIGWRYVSSVDKSVQLDISLTRCGKWIDDVKSTSDRLNVTCKNCLKKDI